MTIANDRAGSVRPGFSRRLALACLMTIAAVAVGYVAFLVDQHTVAVVAARRLLPRWDLATHLGSGWMDYHLLVTVRLHRLIWDLWLQGYWPPLLSIYQIPFYLLLGAGMTSGLRSVLTAFVLTAVAGTALMWRQWRSAALLPASIFVALLVSSPYLLAYASVTMTETLGALIQLVALVAYAWHRHDKTPSTARAFAISLTLLFFTKYNYFLLLVAPLALHEWFERSSGATSAERLVQLGQWGRRALTSPAVVLVIVYLAGVLIVMRTGGFEFQVLERRISVRTVGNSGHVVLYALLTRLWYLHRHRRIDWHRVTRADVLVRPLLVWVGIPVAIWLASPYPNHIRDFANLVINRPLGESTVERGAAIYLEALRTEYFYSGWVLLSVLAAFAVAAVRYRSQPPAIQWIILAVPLQFAAITIHQTRFPRFLLLTVVLLCVAAASEVGRSFAGSPRWRIAGGLLALIVLVAGLEAARSVVGEPRFQQIGFENYTDNPTLRAALDSIRADLSGDDRLAIVGQGNELSPALLRWELGPPSGVPCFPFEIGGARGVDLALASRVLLIIPLGSGASALDLTSYYVAQRQAVLDRVQRDELALRREFQVADMHLALRVYDRTSASDRKAPCE